MIYVRVENRELFWNWCEDQGIICEYAGFSGINSADMWYIENESHKAWAMLRWL